MNLRFEKLSSPIYPGYLHVGDYSIALEPELIQSLKDMTNEEPDRFLEGLIQKVGTNRYLKELIQDGISKAEDRPALAKQLKTELQSM